MPVRLNGLIAVPSGGEGPFPVVLVFHGNHPGCPIPPGDEVDRWPCAVEVERPNYRGFDYLLHRLAEEGYVALSININAENTFGFGEPVAGERLTQLVDRHLQALRAATAGGPNEFGVELEGRADLHRLALFGHSRGGEAAYGWAHSPVLTASDVFDRQGYGPVSGLLLIAPAVVFIKPVGSIMPMAVVLPACDQDVITQDGQYFYEGSRMADAQTQWALSTWLESANHNHFNTTLRDEALARPDRPDCEPLLTPEAQRDFLGDYATDFLTAIFGDEPEVTFAAKGRLGMDVTTLAPDTQYGLSARIATLATATDRLPLFIPLDAGELTTHLAGGNVTATGIDTFYCEPGYSTPFMRPGSEPCKRFSVTIPANPAMLVLSWSAPGGALRFTLPEASRDLTQYTTISLRAAVDPLSPLNAAQTTQAFAVQLTDGTGSTATVATRQDEPALQFPRGNVEEDPFFEGGLFTGRAPMTTIRLRLSDFAGVDLGDIQEIGLLFDQTASGSLFVGDVELVRASAP